MSPDGRNSSKVAREALKKTVFLGIIPKQGGGVGIPKLYVKLWWPMQCELRFPLLLHMISIS